MRIHTQFTRKIALILLLTQITALLCIMPVYAAESMDKDVYEVALNELIDFEMAQKMDDMHKALYAFKQLTYLCEYDYDTRDGINITYESYWAYGAVVNHKAVCSGYTNAYIDIMTRLGVPCEYVRSSP